jgi:hypothetical protein
MSTLSLWVDESERGSFLAIGGILVEWNQVPALVDGWRNLKASLGLDAGAELKWNLPEDHPTRDALARLGRSAKDVAARAVQYLASESVSFVVVVMCDVRDLSKWRRIWQKASVRDFYCEGLRYVLQRAAEEVAISGVGSCVVVCDTPELGRHSFALRSIRRGSRAVQEAYADWYKRGVGLGPGGVHHDGTLRDAGFHPSILVGDATYHDMLQMADVVVGATGNWVAAINDGRGDPWMVQQIGLLSSKFRARYGTATFWGDGLVLWPPDHPLWKLLKESI